MGFHRDRRAERPTGVVEELETLVRRLRLLPLVVPVLLLLGWGLGGLTVRGITLPEGAPVRIAAAEHTPRNRLAALSEYMHGLREVGENTEEYVVLYANHVRPVEVSLERWGIRPSLARQVAWPLVEHSYARGLDPATVVAIVLVESSGRPGATSFVGARGLMQIMPVHQGRWGCGADMYDIDVNLCYGTHILASNLERFRGDERRALLAYNGCVRGANTPNCHSYPAKVQRLRETVRAEWRELAPATYDAVRLGSTTSAAAAGP